MAVNRYRRIGNGARTLHNLAEVSDLGGAAPNPSTTAPIADNELDIAIRTGTAGTSADYARGDHNHPIRRQANPGFPTLTYTLVNGSTAPQTSNLDFWSDEETVHFEYRVRVDAQPGTGWNHINIPNLAGFQRPRIFVTGSYRNTGNPQRDDAGAPVNQGAMPTAPIMNNEACHWSSTQRVYVGPNRSEAFARYYVGVLVSYTRS